MTKRPCAIAFSQNGKSILVGDKFGDVYALPLHHDPSAVTQTAAKAVAKPSAAPFRPAATNLTVHSKRNLTALENQQRQAANPQHSGKEKEAMDFEHELLLGHVSMLTDLVIATSRVSHVRREYIITADRDEHIRVSRGQPQAHIIENYCFGHTAFVSRLCLANDDTLVSGGGDDYLCVWDWRYGRLLTKLNLREAIAQHSRPPGSSQTPPANVTVSTLRAHSVGDSAGRIAIFCACEATAAIVVFEIDVSQPLGDVTEPTHVRHLPARHGNVLDVVVHETGLRAGKLEYRLIVSLDSLHRPNSKEVGADAGVQLIQVTRDGFGDMPAQAIEVSDDAVKQSVDLLYGLDKLRKKGGEDE